jgi:integrase
MFALSLRVGLRPGEATSLCWGDLDANVLHIRRGVQVHSSTPVVVDQLKTSTAERSIELPADLVAWLEDHRREQVSERLAASEWHDPRLMFASTSGRVISRPNVARQLSAICKSAGVRTPDPTSFDIRAPRCSPTSASQTSTLPICSVTQRRGRWN